MKKTILLFLSIVIIGLSHSFTHAWCKAVVIVPYVDVIHYQHQPDGMTPYQDALLTKLLSPKDTKDHWPRTAQILFNERVHVVKKKNGYVLVSLDNYMVDQKTPLQGWVKKEALKPLYTFGNNLYGVPDETQLSGSLTLVEPWADDITKKIYSAGTRFVRNAAQDIDPDFYSVFIYDPQRNSIVTSLVPHYAIVIDYRRSVDQQRELFIATLKKWCLYHAPINYLCGGMSFTSLQPMPSTIQECYYNDTQHECFVTCEHHTQPLSGFDCSGVIFRAARIAGIPYTLLTTTAIEHSLEPLTEQHCLEVGDFLYRQGHVMIVACLQPALLFEAVDHASGYARVHTIELNKKFKDITAWHDLLRYFFEHKTPIELYADGSEDPNHYPITFLRFKSIWSDVRDNQSS